VKFINLIFILLLLIISCQNTKNEKSIANTDILVTEHSKDINRIHKTEYPDYLNIDFITGNFDPAKHPQFIRVEEKYTNKTNIFIDRETYRAFKKMYIDAYRAGFRLVIVSAARNFDYQKRVWNYKWSKLSDTLTDFEKTKNILEYSSMPGSSRHHWGTEIDLNVLENSYYEQGDGRKILDWMKANAKNYGFCQPYTTDREKGFKEERWHWSYMPLSKIYFIYMSENMKDEYIKGFKGAEFAHDLKITQDYMLSINQDCILNE